MNHTAATNDSILPADWQLIASEMVRNAGGQRLIDEVSLRISGGDRIAIVGRSGSGKTVLLRALARLDPIDEGELRWCGELAIGNAIPPFRARVMYLHQRPALLEGTVEFNLRQPYSLRVFQGRAFQRERVVQWLLRMERDARFLDKQQRDLSGGESQLVALLRAIQLGPSLLLLDEPTSALDAETTTMVEGLIDQWIAEQPDSRGTLWVTHDRPQAERVAQRVLTMERGHLMRGSHAKLR